MKIFKSEKELTSFLFTLKREQKKIGFVPTMGALHQGHISLIATAKKQCDVVLCSIFVNPTQFDNKNDLKNYPISIEDDINLLKSISCDLVFIPTVHEMYPKGEKVQKYDFGGLQNEMEGAFRKGHFDGVGTIVHRFFNIVRPDVAFFGEKDFQQLQIIKKLIEIENLPIKIVGCPIFREKDGLAMSSRNRKLSKEMRKEAPVIYKVLKKVQEKITTESIPNIESFVKHTFEKSKLELEYFLICNTQTLKPTQIIDKKKKYRAFMAVFADDVRLIDNIVL
ncbi:MAG: pantoate--beta-alanine ligase [Flavobacteriales bacterium]